MEFIRRFVGACQIDCMVIDSKTPQNLLLHLIVTDQNSAGLLSLAEKARFVNIAARYFTTEEIVHNFFDTLKLKNWRTTIPLMHKILQQDEIVIKDIHAGRLQDKMVSEILSLPEETDRLALVQFFRRLGMGDGKQKRFFKLFRDIAFREGTSISEYMQRKEITDIIGHEEMNIPQKIQHLGVLLQHAIAPSSSQAEQAFIEQVKKLRLPANHSISHSPAFEKDEVTLSITFKDFQECSQFLDANEEIDNL